jgi:hypothetical protein
MISKKDVSLTSSRHEKSVFCQKLERSNLFVCPKLVSLKEDSPQKFVLTQSYPCVNWQPVISKEKDLFLGFSSSQSMQKWAFPKLANPPKTT